MSRAGDTRPLNDPQRRLDRVNHGETLSLRDAGWILGLDDEGLALAVRVLDAKVRDGSHGTIGFLDGESPNAICADDVTALAALVLAAVSAAAGWQNVQVTL